MPTPQQVIRLFPLEHYKIKLWYFLQIPSGGLDNAKEIQKPLFYGKRSMIIELAMEKWPPLVMTGMLLP